MLRLSEHDMERPEQERASLAGMHAGPVAATEATRAKRAALDRYLSTRQVARMLDVSERTVRKWCGTGLLKVVQPAGPKGVWRIVAAQFSVTPGEMGAIVRKVRSLNRRLGFSELDDYEA